MSACILGGKEQDRDDRLELYALGRLAAPEVEKVEEHLLICDFCRDRLDEVAAFAFSAREALKETPLRSSFWPGFSWLANPGLWRPGLSIASAVAVLVLAVGIYRVWLGGTPAPIAALHLSLARNASIPAAVPSRELDIDFADAPDASRVAIVGRLGDIVWTGAIVHSPTGAIVRIQASLPEGGYLARTYTANGTFIHEYEFRIAH